MHRSNAQQEKKKVLKGKYAFEFVKIRLLNNTTFKVIPLCRGPREERILKEVVFWLEWS